MLKIKPILNIVFLLISSVGITQVSYQKYPIAGLNPNSRPENAPIITEFFKDSNWYSQALKGVTNPYPSSLQFLEDQGAWHTPFNQPGLKGAYDIRNWYKRE